MMRIRGRRIGAAITRLPGVVPAAQFAPGIGGLQHHSRHDPGMAGGRGHGDETR